MFSYNLDSSACWRQAARDGLEENGEHTGTEVALGL